MILKNQPLSDYVASYNEAGLKVAAFPATTNPKRYVLRLVDPDDPETGTSYLASFAQSVKEADRPTDERQQTIVSQRLDAMLSDPVQMSRYTVCYCVVDRESLLKFSDRYTEDDLGRQFITVTKGTAKSDSYREYAEASAEKEADAKPKRTRARH